MDNLGELAPFGDGGLPLLPEPPPFGDGGLMVVVMVDIIPFVKVTVLVETEGVITILPTGGTLEVPTLPLLPGLLPVRVMVVVPVRVWPSESVDGKKETMSVSVVVLLETVVVYGGGSEKESVLLFELPPFGEGGVTVTVTVVVLPLDNVTVLVETEGLKMLGDGLTEDGLTEDGLTEDGLTEDGLCDGSAGEGSAGLLEGLTEDGFTEDGLTEDGLCEGSSGFGSSGFG